MIPLNLPSYPIKLAGTRQKPSIFDILRRKYVALTPEEWVRQHFVHFLIEHKGYPSSLLANEVSLKIGEKSLRADTVLYDRNLQPRMIIEYKAPSIPLTTHVLNQVGNYNRLLHVDYVIISNGLQHYCCKMDYASQRFVLLEDIPPYQEMKD
ncbi:MAG: type I restriction enzyme HsdR N-terminal domain-containing protein [Prevotella sp.]|nr:type I restriction enzyme HsdR N-terminal domain-containing protein [Prevotella sp.]MBQ2333764.1 type I restriction enzyme HsdR N-terminal domain-containing protein [Prevotella sp.]MBQ2359873.1 type I restriction enzyme HsdR N-terminal domain-containing protein [Prevotella sp.]MBQ2523448.1 type I restriction enzyme HsdR N-terminal domain-containing protein [Prevotella sp.]